MKNLNELNKKVASLELEGTISFSVIIREDNYDNTGDAVLRAQDEFASLEEAYNAYLSDSSTSFETNSEYKEIELVVTSDQGDFEVLESELSKREYEEEDYGKFLISYRPNNNGIEAVGVTVIDAYTKYYASSENRCGTKFQIENTKEDAIKFIWNKKLYMSMEDCEELVKYELKK